MSRELKVHKRAVTGPSWETICNHFATELVPHHRYSWEWKGVTCLRCLNKRPAGTRLTREQMRHYLESDPDGAELPEAQKVNERKPKVHKTGWLGDGIVCRRDCQRMQFVRHSSFWGEVTCLRCLRWAPERMRPERPQRSTTPTVTVRYCAISCPFIRTPPAKRDPPTCNFPGIKSFPIPSAEFVDIPEKCPLRDGDRMVKYTLEEKS